MTQQIDAPMYIFHSVSLLLCIKIGHFHQNININWISLPMGNVNGVAVVLDQINVYILLHSMPTKFYKLIQICLMTIGLTALWSIHGFLLLGGLLHEHVMIREQNSQPLQHHIHWSEYLYHY